MPDAIIFHPKPNNSWKLCLLNRNRGDQWLKNQSRTVRSSWAMMPWHTSAHTPMPNRAIAMTIDPLVTLAKRVILVWVLKSIRLVSRTCCTIASAPMIMVKDDTLVSDTSSSLPKKSAIKGEHKKIMT